MMPGFFLGVLIHLIGVDARMIAPLRRSTALKLLQRLCEECSHDLISIDIGGTLAKVMLYQPVDTAPEDGKPPALDLGEALANDAAFKDPEQLALSLYAPELRGNLHFFVFETRHMIDVIAFVKRHWPDRQARSPARKPIQIRATGGGAVKHQDAMRTAGLALDLEDEMAAMVAGLDFLLRQIPGEVFRVDMDALGSWSPLTSPADCAELAKRYVPCTPPPSEFLYVSIGSGVSIVEVRVADGRTRYRRVGGSSVGGSTFWGLVKLLTSCGTFDEVIRLTESGSSANVDMLVGDIYGGDCDAIGLRGDVIAASFGKVSMQREEERFQGPMFFLRYIAALVRHYEEGFWLVVLTILNSVPGVKHIATVMGLVRWAEARAASVAMCGGFRAHDVAIALLRMVSNNIGHIATMCASQHKMPHIVFGGSFIRDHPYTIATISSGVRFYSRGAVQALFLKHDGFVGAVGAHIAGRPSPRLVERMPDTDAPAVAHSPPIRDYTVGATAGAQPDVGGALDGVGGGEGLAPPLASTDAAAASDARAQLAAEVAERGRLETELRRVRAELTALRGAEHTPGDAGGDDDAPPPPPAAAHTDSAPPAALAVG